MVDAEITAAFEGFNPFAPGYIENPYAQFEELRRLDPVHTTQFEAVYLTRYDDVLALLRNPELSVDPANATPSVLWHLAAEALGRDPNEGRVSRSMLDKDDPDHLRLRKLVSHAFTPRRIAQRRDSIRALVDERLDAVFAAGRFDAISDLAFPLPFDVISDMLGMGETDKEHIRDVSGMLVRNLEPVVDPDMIRAIAAAEEEIIGLVYDVIMWKRANPADDLLTLLIDTEVEGDRLNDEELLSQVILLFVAGHETTVNLIGNGLLALARHPDQYRRLRDDPSLIEGAVEEMLRFDPPVQMTRRIPLVDMEIGGVPVLKGSFVLASLASANRDPAHFGDDAATFDVTRPMARDHLSFGGGSHYCLGASLAKLEAQVAIGAIVERFATLELAGDIEYNGRINLRGLERLPLVVA